MEGISRLTEVGSLTEFVLGPPHGLMLGLISSRSKTARESEEAK